jgi:hypothetical protein
MSHSPAGYLTAVSRLRRALEDTATALAAADLDRLLAADTALQAALQALPSLASVDSEERGVFRRELEAAAAALLQCRRLGVGLSDFVRISLDAHGGQLGYEPTRTAAAALTGRGFTRRV